MTVFHFKDHGMSYELYHDVPSEVGGVHSSTKLSPFAHDAIDTRCSPQSRGDDPADASQMNT